MNEDKQDDVFKTLLICSLKDDIFPCSKSVKNERVSCKNAEIRSSIYVASEGFSDEKVQNVFGSSSIFIRNLRVTHSISE